MNKLKSLLVCLPLVLAAACGDDGGKAPQDASPHDAGVDSGPADASCFTNPTTHDQIINACTTAQKIYKTSHPPLLNMDGSLPALPP